MSTESRVAREKDCASACPGLKWQEALPVTRHLSSTGPPAPISGFQSAPGFVVTLGRSLWLGFQSSSFTQG